MIGIIVIMVMFPFLFTCLLYFILKKIGMSRAKSIGLASDFTTPILLFAVPILFNSIWDFSITYILLAFLVFIGILFTYKEWRSKKEIEIPVLIKKIWRAAFLILTFLYICIMGIGFITWVIKYTVG